jgi:signal peptidase I
MRTDRRSVLRKANHLSREVPRLLYKYRRRLSQPRMWEVADATRSLRTGLGAQTRDLDIIAARSEHLENLIDRYIQFDPRDELWDYAETLVAALLIALFIRTFLFEAFRIPSGSMIPTMMVEDHIFVSKFIYGVRVPFSRFKVMDWRDPAKGEVIVFEYPGPGREHGKDFIKRTVAVPGDTVRLEDNLLYVNGKVTGGTRVIAREAQCLLTPGEVCQWRPLSPGSVEVGARAISKPGCPCTLMFETGGSQEWVTQHLWPGGECDCQTPEERQFNARNVSDWPDLRQHAAFLSGWGSEAKGARWMHRLTGGRSDMEVPEGYVFVMGDNRDNSKDGRYWGLVPLENIRGKALFIWWAGENRMDRIFRRVH